MKKKSSHFIDILDSEAIKKDFIFFLKEKLDFTDNEIYTNPYIVIKNKDKEPTGIIFSGGPASVHKSRTPKIDQKIFSLNIPILVLWGKHGLINKCFNPIEIWQKYSEKVVIGESLNCYHFIPEEIPKILDKKLKQFLQ